MVNAQVTPVPDRYRTGRTDEPRHQPMTCPVLPPPYREDRSDSAPSGQADAAAAAAFDLLRTALLAKLAVDLDDPVLSRRAATEAAGHARLLAGLDYPPAVDDDAVHAEVVDGQPLEVLLRRLYPPAVVLDDEPTKTDDHDEEPEPCAS